MDKDLLYAAFVVGGFINIIRAGATSRGVPDPMMAKVAFALIGFTLLLLGTYYLTSSDELGQSD